MPKQINRHIKLSGTIDDISFYKSQDGFLARAKGGVSGDRIKTDPKFRNTLLNGMEFATGGKAGKLFRAACNTEIDKAADNRVVSRITQLMVRILKTDPESDYGQRKVSLGNMALLKDFEFNNAMSFDQVFKLPLTAGINRVTGTSTVTVPDHVPVTDMAAPDGATHYNFFVAAAAIDFEGNQFTVVRQQTPNLPWGNTNTTMGPLTLTLPANSLLPLFLLVGIEFVLTVNGKVYPQSKSVNALRIAAVDLASPI
ncbi:MAG: hypothetical protein DI539_19195 [Flavobacterium psychrophilum]|nr:MAG: hypothetical protein DI539_19195 [Flavobacterium psychrophilum]